MGNVIIDLAATRPVLPRFPAYGISILESRHAQNFQMRPSAYDFAEVMLILEGVGWIHTVSRRWRVAQNSIIVVPPSTTYHYEDDPTTRLAMLSLCLRPEGSLHTVLEPVLPKRFRVIQHQALSREVARQFRTVLMAEARPQTSSVPVICSATLRLLLDLENHHRAGKQPNPGSSSGEAFSNPELTARVQQYLENLDRSFHEPQSMDAAASALEMSRRSFSHYFKQLTGQSHLVYVRKLRIAHACTLLESNEPSVIAVAFACGYLDLSSFLRAFKKETGLNPSEWRQMRARQNHRPPPFRHT